MLQVILGFIRCISDFQKPCASKTAGLRVKDTSRSLCYLVLCGHCLPSCQAERQAPGFLFASNIGNSICKQIVLTRRFTSNSENTTCIQNQANPLIQNSFSNSTMYYNVEFSDPVYIHNACNYVNCYLNVSCWNRNVITPSRWLACLYSITSWILTKGPTLFSPDFWQNARNSPTCFFGGQELNTTRKTSNVRQNS